MQITRGKQLAQGINHTVYICDFNGEKAIMKITDPDKSIEDKIAIARAFNALASKHSSRLLILKWSALDAQHRMTCIYGPVLRYSLCDIKHKMSNATRKAVFMHLRKTLDIMHAAGWSHNHVMCDNIMCDAINNPASYMLTDYDHVTQLSGRVTQLSGRVTQLSGRVTQLSCRVTQQTNISNDLINLTWCLLKNPVYDIITQQLAKHRDKATHKTTHKTTHSLNDKTAAAYIRANTKLKGPDNEIILKCALVDYSTYICAIKAPQSLIKKYATYTDVLSVVFDRLIFKSM